MVKKKISSSELTKKKRSRDSVGSVVSTKKISFQSVKGMHDILPLDQCIWERMRDELRDIGVHYGFQRIDTPILEERALLERGVGDVTDIVEKQMFEVTGTKQNVVMRPENTAAIVRAYIEHGMSHLKQPVRLYYIGPMFRHEQPQEGRFRQFHQAGFEILGGESDPIFDAQIILVCFRMLEALKINRLSIKLNTVGCRVCRTHYRKALIDYYRNKNVCQDCKRRAGKNVMRLLDCKNTSCIDIAIKGVPTILDHLCLNCHTHFKMVLEYLEELHLPYELDHTLVRGLDYYNKTVFEIFTEEVSSALAGGGRYDYLMEMLGGRKTHAVGAALGLERLVSVIKKRDIHYPNKQQPSVFLIHIGELAKKKSLLVMEQLRCSKIQVEEALGKNSMRAQLKQADKEGMRIVLIFGQKEAFEDSIILRDMETGVQETIPLNKLIDRVKKYLK